MSVMTASPSKSGFFPLGSGSERGTPSSNHPPLPASGQALALGRAGRSGGDGGGTAVPAVGGKKVGSLREGLVDAARLGAVVDVFKCKAGIVCRPALSHDLSERKQIGRLACPSARNLGADHQ